MLDIKLIREFPNQVEQKLKTKDDSISLSHLLQLDEEIRKIKTLVEGLKNDRNTLSKEIGEKKRKNENADEQIERVNTIGEQIKHLDEKLAGLEENFLDQLARLPNIPMDGIKVAMSPKENVCIKEHGQATQFPFPYKNHLEINDYLGLFDFERGAKISGAGWPVYSGLGARLEWGLINMMLDYHLQKGFKQWMVPLLVRPEMMYASGQFPKFKDQAYELQDKQFDMCLIPTAEVALNALHFDEVFSDDELPQKYVAYTPCFRREAGAAGKNERGLIRTHQFNKVEMFAFCTPEQSEEIFNEFVSSAEAILEMLELPYKRMLLVTGDMSFAAAKTIDIEVYLPGQESYKEVSSISNCTDFQSRRSKIRYKESSGKPQLVHTLNGSGLATSRVMVALLENHQQEDGSVKIPLALQKYVGGMAVLEPPSQE